LVDSKCKYIREDIFQIISERTFQNSKKPMAKNEKSLNPIEEYFGIIHTKEREKSEKVPVMS
jgi:hypothetical protein